MARIERDVTIPNSQGMHMRPVAQFVELASRYGCKITVSNGSRSADNAKSIMAMLPLASPRGAVLTIRADGDDAQQAVDALVDLVSGGFGEMDDENSG